MTVALAERLYTRAEVERMLAARAELFPTVIDGSRAPDAHTWLYFIQAGERGPIKVGLTDSPPSRLRTLQTAQHEELRVRAIVRAHRRTETFLHDVFRGDRIRGEWFDASPLIEWLIAQASAYCWRDMERAFA